MADPKGGGVYLVQEEGNRMSEVDFSNLLHKSEYLAFEVARTASFFIVLWQLMDKHFQIKACIVSLATIIVERSGRRHEKSQGS